MAEILFLKPISTNRLLPAKYIVKTAKAPAGKDFTVQHRAGH